MCVFDWGWIGGVFFSPHPRKTEPWLKGIQVILTVWTLHTLERNLEMKIHLLLYMDNPVKVSLEMENSLKWKKRKGMHSYLHRKRDISYIQVLQISMHQDYPLLPESFLFSILPPFPKKMLALSYFPSNTRYPPTMLPN